MILYYSPQIPLLWLGLRPVGPTPAVHGANARWWTSLPGPRHGIAICVPSWQLIHGWPSSWPCTRQEWPCFSRNTLPRTVCGTTSCSARPPPTIPPCTGTSLRRTFLCGVLPATPRLPPAKPTAARQSCSPFGRQLCSPPFAAAQTLQHASDPHPPPPTDQPPAGPSPLLLAARYVGSTTTSHVSEAMTAAMHTSAGPLAATDRIQAGVATSGSSELARARTPLRHSQFERELAHYPDKAWVTRLLHGIRYGVDIGYMGPRQPMNAPNLPSARTHPHIITAQLQKEVEAGRIRGPFPERPLPALRCSGLGVVPKKGNKWRMILHLSTPAGASINDHISKANFSLQYSSIDDAVRMLIALGPGALMSKADLKSTFRMVPVRPQDWELLGMRWQDHYFFDTCLPFGLRSAPFLFNEYAEALQWILQHNHGLSSILHYLDDYLIAGPPTSTQCARHLTTFLEVCDDLGIPVAMDKVDGPAAVLTFLGLELDSTQQRIRLPPDKLAELLAELRAWSDRSSTTKRELLSLIGKLSFAAGAVPAGRLFLRRLISLSTTVRSLHHRIRLGVQARADIAWWSGFLPSWNGTAHFINPDRVAAHDLELYTDASGTLGCGAYFQGAWFHYPWQPHQRQLSIQWQELFAIVAAALTWGHQWHGRRICFFCDNLTIVTAWQHKSARNPALLNLLRRLFLHAAQHNYTASFQHLPGQSNCLADALSRRQFTRFYALAPQAAQEPTPTPGVLTTL